MHFDEFESKFEKCKGNNPCILMNFDSKLEKCKGVCPCILMNFDSKLEKCKCLVHAFWWILTQNSKNVKVLINPCILMNLTKN